MGLEIVELFMRVEEEFNIVISDEEACRCETPGQLHALILQKLDFDLSSKRCLSSVAFYRVRRALMSTCGVSRRDVWPNTSLNNLLPLESRDVLWSRLGNEIQSSLPTLQRPLWFHQMHFGITALWIVSCFVLAVTLGLHWFAFSFVAGGIMLHQVYARTENLAAHFSSDCMTVGDLTKAILPVCLADEATPEKTINANDVWETLRRIMVDELGVEEQLLIKDAHFVRDLDLG